MGDLPKLLNLIIEQPEHRAEILRQIETDFAQTKAIMVLDMSGFTRTTQTYGIGTFLLMIHQMKLLATPVVGEFGGTLVKAEADNLYCLFDDVESALQASRTILARLRHANFILPSTRRLYASIGIGFGAVIVLDHDLFGDEVNLTCKLGEDIADAGEILLTASAMARTSESMNERTIEISGIKLTYYVA